MKNETYEAGLAMRREVLGDAYVDASLAAADDFTGPLQDYLTEHAWGAVWTRPGLEKKTRSMLNLAMLTALNRPAELRLHLRGALRNGVTRDEIREVLLQVAVYAGIPAGIDSFRAAKEALASLPDDVPDDAKT
jgi:4-carboxymuconolactone decarboxylase